MYSVFGVCDRTARIVHHLWYRHCNYLCYILLYDLMFQVEGIQPMVTIEDTVEAEGILKADAKVQRLIRERYGITNMEEVACDPW
jgi:hypothetical protein